MKQAAKRIRRASRRAGRKPQLARNDPRGRSRSADAIPLGALGRGDRAIERGCAVLVLAGADRRQHRAAGRNPADDDHRRVSHSRRQAVGRRAGCGLDACGPRAGADHRRCRDDHPREPDRHARCNAIDTIMQLERERPPGRTFIARRIERGSIVFDNVTFKYPGAAQNALENVSFRIGSGERVGIIGRVGSGKTTVGRLMAGFYDPDDGKVLVDDIDLRQYDPPTCAPASASCFRTPISFSASCATTSRSASRRPPTRKSSRPRGSRASKSFIAGHPLGYEMPVAEGGKQPFRRPKAGDRARASADPQSESAVPGRADRAFRHSQRSRVPGAAEIHQRGPEDDHHFKPPHVGAQLRRPHPVVRERAGSSPTARRDKVIAMLTSGDVHRERTSMRGTDFAFANDVRAAAELRTPQTSHS